MLARLRAEGLEPAPEADRLTLIRRATFDLTGLAPTPAEVDAYLGDEHPDAHERLIDRLLASPHYGERWARHWLDLVRYADSNGYRADEYRPDSWRYRDYVVQALNSDKPYARFVTEQLAGDELAPADPRVLVATTYLRLWTYEHNQRDVKGQWEAILNDVTDVTGDVFLGLGIGCARCHDHKFDPILQDDYYRLQAFFTPMLPRDDLHLTTPEQWATYQEKLAVWESKTETIRASIEALERPFKEKAAAGAVAKFPDDIKQILSKPEADRTPYEEQLYRLAYLQIIEEYDKLKLKGPERERWDALQKELAAFDAVKPAEPPRRVYRERCRPERLRSPPFPATGRNGRSRRVICRCSMPRRRGGRDRRRRPTRAGRRLALASWLTRPDNPLVPRVMVNRIWHYHFGSGLVATPSDFGRLGERPSHPELLDWLASEFLRVAGSLKAMHRLIMTSATYRQTALRAMPEVARIKDPENRLLWRINPRRLEIEPIRDAMLEASGELDLTVGGPGVATDKPRRTLYTKVMRNTRDPLLEQFDAPDGSNTTPTRNVTVTPSQSLMLINGGWVLQRARNFADRLQREAGDDSADRVRLAYRLAFGRSPSVQEQADALAFLRRSGPADTESLVDFCHDLLNANEFLYVD